VEFIAERGRQGAYSSFSRNAAPNDASRTGQHSPPCRHSGQRPC
jgi:hypothetical protein